MADNAAYARDWLTKKGYAPYQAAAMAGHIVQESGVRPDAVGDNGTAYGIAQWRGPRQAALYDYAKSTGQDVRNLDTQLGFLDRELNTTEKTAGDALRASTDIRGATRAGMMFERPQGYTAANPEAGHGWANRFGEAQRLFGGPVMADAAPAQAAPSGATFGPAAVQPVPPTMLAAAFAPQQIGDEFAKRQAAAVADQQARKRQLFGAGGLGELFG